MALLKLKNEAGEILMYKINIGDTPGELQRLDKDEVRTMSGEYLAGTKMTVWWKRGDGVDVRDCYEPGCSPGEFVMPAADAGIRFGKDLDRFPEQTC